MKKLVLISLAAFLFIGGCSTQPSGPFAVTARSDVQKALPYIRPGTSVACSAVLALAVGEKDRADVAGDIYTISSVVYALSGSGTVSPEQLHAAIAKVAPKSAEYEVLATTVQGIYAGLFPQLKGDPKLTLDVLSAIAGGCSDAALVFMRAPASSPTPPSAASP